MHEMTRTSCTSQAEILSWQPARGDLSHSNCQNFMLNIEQNDILYFYYYIIHLFYHLLIYTIYLYIIKLLL